MNPINLKYGAEALFFIGVAFRLLRWALGALAEGDAPPSAYADDGGLRSRPSLQLTLSGLQSIDPTKATAAGAFPGQSSSALRITTEVGGTLPSAPLGLRALGIAGGASKDIERPPRAGDPALFPQAMLDAMTPEQRAQVLGSLAKQRAVNTGTMSAKPQAPALDPTLFPPSMLAAMTPEQRAQVLSTLTKQRAASAGTTREESQAPSLDPTLFPPSMLAAMTPEQRAQVLSTLAKQRAGGTGR